LCSPKTIKTELKVDATFKKWKGETMKSLLQQTGKPRKKTVHFPRNMAAFVAAILLMIFFAAAEASAHEWTLNGRKVNALVSGFDGRTVTFELQNNRSTTVNVQDLSAEDLQYLKALVDLYSQPKTDRRASFNRRIQLRQLQVQLEQYRSQWYEMWVVQFVSPRGEYFYWAYPVRNSYQAMTRARYQFPNSRILFVKKLHRQYR